jgi:hypothetical protein
MALVSDYEEGRFSFEGGERHVIFSDYLDWSWAYALCLRGRGAGGVVIIGTADGRPNPVAATFSGFLEKYHDDALL